MQEFKEVQFDTVSRVKVFTIDEAVKATGIGRAGIQKMINDQDSKFPYFKVGTKTLIPAAALETWFIEISQERRRFA